MDVELYYLMTASPGFRGQPCIDVENMQPVTCTSFYSDKRMDLHLYRYSLRGVEKQLQS